MNPLTRGIFCIKLACWYDFEHLLKDFAMTPPTWTRKVWLAACCLALAACSTVGDKLTPERIARYTHADFVAPIASSAGSDAQLADARAKISAGLMLDSSFAQIAQALWAVQFFGIEQAVGLTLLERALPKLIEMTPAEQRGVLSAAHTIAPRLAAPLVRPQLSRIATPREFAIASHVLMRGGTQESSKTDRKFISDAKKIAFPTEPVMVEDPDIGEPRLLALQRLLADHAPGLARPPLLELLRAPFKAGLPVVYSFQRTGRQHFGLVMIRGADGKFVRNDDGSYFALPQLALALTELPGTLTNGNTPQGLFTIVGAGIANNKWIGPTPYLESRVPVEATVADFEHTAASQGTVTWGHERYTALLPQSWRGYAPFQEAYLAGRAGRDEMIIHGTTINSNNYSGRSFYPGTPSAGCLVVMETWDADTGQMTQSNQLRLLKAFTKDGFDRGYLVVVELDSEPRAVALSDLASELEAIGN